MPSIHPFRALTYPQPDVSTLIAPPYDVLDSAAKAALLNKNPRNIVAVDLPHTPAKQLGPPGAYTAAAELLQSWRRDGTLRQLPQPALFAYRQTTAGGNAPSQRCGMAACLDLVPFGPRDGGGILPHEETFSGPKEDRAALMRATGVQLSPIFGLHPDERGIATSIIHEVMARRPADQRAEMGDGVVHEVWTITDAPTINAYTAALSYEDVFIADGHHRYSTALNHLAALESAGPIAPDHLARRIMMVLVGMSDPGLRIWPTHRVLGGIAGYSLEAFLAAAKDHIISHPFKGDLPALDAALEAATHLGPMRFALYDFATRRALLAAPSSSDPLAKRFPKKPAAWRHLVVAFTQYILVEEIAQKALNRGENVKWAFPHTIAEVLQIGQGLETGAGGGANFAQLAIIVRPTPLEAVRDVSRANELMPQKSTFFYPKLATGLFLNPLE